MSSVFPFISIVIPTHNRPRQLRRCLDALAEIDYPRDDFEVIVVNDGGDYPLDDVISQFEATLDIRLIRQSNAGPAAARNSGAAAARGELLAFTDDDCRPAPGWLTALAEAHAAHSGALIGGRTTNALPENSYAEATQLLIDYLYEYYRSEGKQGGFFTSNNMAVPAAHFAEIGGFDTSFPLAAGEDREFCDRWLARGWPMHFAPTAEVHHAHDLDLRRFWRQHFNYGRGALAFKRARERRGEQRVQHEPLRFYWGIVRHPLKDGSYSGSALLGLTQVANALGYYYESLTGRRASAPPRRTRRENG